MELNEFAEEFASSTKHLKSGKARANTMLKYLIDKLFPLCSVSRADRLKRRIDQLLAPLSSLSDDNETNLFLRKTWKPQPTGSFTRITALYTIVL